jgi:hypothetical protein
MLNFDFDNDPRMEPRDLYSKRAQRYSRVGWLQEQSMCYEKRAFIELKPMLTFETLCYGFNMDRDMFDESM